MVVQADFLFFQCFHRHVKLFQDSQSNAMFCYSIARFHPDSIYCSAKIIKKQINMSSAARRKVNNLNMAFKYINEVLAFAITMKQ